MDILIKKRNLKWLTIDLYTQVTYCILHRQLEKSGTYVTAFSWPIWSKHVDLWHNKLYSIEPIDMQSTNYICCLKVA